MSEIERLIEKSMKITEDKKKQLKALFPEVFREDKIDFEQLKKVSLKKEVYLDENFRRLWGKINYKTRYSVKFDRNKLVDNCVSAIKSMEAISASVITTATGKLELRERGITGDPNRIKKEDVAFSGFLPDILGFIQRETELTRKTIAEILIKSGRLQEFNINPSRFMEQAVKCIKEELHALMVEGIKYEKLEGQVWEMRLFEEEDEKEVMRYLNNLFEVKKSLHDAIEYDSEIEKEFARKLDEREDIKLFVKLPRWFLVETPVGNYNPDWAIIKTLNGTEDKLYFIRETKSTKDKNKLRGIEYDKITCGKKHFEALNVDFKVVCGAEEV